MAYVNGARGYAALRNPSRPWWPDIRTRTLGIVLHETEGLADYVPPDASAENAANYAAFTDRASWHITVDSDSIVDTLPLAVRAWAQGVPGKTYNNDFISIEIGTKGTDWRAKPAAWVDGLIRQLADVCASLCRDYGLPVQHVRDQDIIDRMLGAGKKVGLVYHGDLSWDRSDPGLLASHGTDTFPMSRLLAEINAKLGSAPIKAPGDALAVDGQWGADTTRVAQQLAGTATDGAISGQLQGDIDHWPAVYAFELGQGGSQLVRAIQTMLNHRGAPAHVGLPPLMVDGLAGVKTCRALQAWCGVTVDGSFGRASVSAFQRILNRFTREKKGLR